MTFPGAAGQVRGQGLDWGRGRARAGGLAGPSLLLPPCAAFARGQVGGLGGELTHIPPPPLPPPLRKSTLSSAPASALHRLAILGARHGAGGVEGHGRDHQATSGRSAALES